MIPLDNIKLHIRDIFSRQHSSRNQNSKTEKKCKWKSEGKWTFIKVERWRQVGGIPNGRDLMNHIRMTNETRWRSHFRSIGCWEKRKSKSTQVFYWHICRASSSLWIMRWVYIFFKGEKETQHQDHQNRQQEALLCFKSSKSCPSVPIL